MITHRRRTLSLLMGAVALAVLSGCGSDTVEQAGPLDLSAASGTPTPSPSAEPSEAPTSTPSVTSTPTTAPSPTPTAAAVPGFLEGTDLPKHPTSAWFAGKVTAGQPEFGPFCVEDALKTQQQIWHRQFGTEFDTNGSQVVARLDSTADAEAFMDVLSHDVALCAENWVTGFPAGRSDSEDYGAPSATTHVYGVYTWVPNSEDGAHLYGIGRDGALVTVVQWAQMGNLDDAPVEAFRTTTITAVEKLS